MRTTDAEAAELAAASSDTRNAPPPMPLLLAWLPLVLVIGVNALFTYFVFPAMDLSALDQRFDGLVARQRTGLWALIIALVTACAALLVLRLGRWAHLQQTVNKGVLGSMLPIFNTASEVGYGAVIASLPAKAPAGAADPAPAAGRRRRGREPPRRTPPAEARRESIPRPARTCRPGPKASSLISSMAASWEVSSVR